MEPEIAIFTILFTVLTSGSHSRVIFLLWLGSKRHKGFRKLVICVRLEYRFVSFAIAY